PGATVDRDPAHSAAPSRYTLGTATALSRCRPRKTLEERATRCHRLPWLSRQWIRSSPGFEALTGVSVRRTGTPPRAPGRSLPPDVAPLRRSFGPVILVISGPAA